MAVSRLALISVAAVAIVLALVARVVHGARIRHFHDDAGALRATVPTTIIVASDLEALSTHLSWAGGAARLTET